MHCLKCLQPLADERAHYGMHGDCFSTWFQVPKDAKFTSFTRRSATSLEEEQDSTSQNNSFYHGKFKKYSATLCARTFILKMGQPEAPELPVVEYLCNQIAEALEIPVASFSLIQLEGELVFATENFVTGQKLMIDLKHIHHFRTGEQHNCKDLIELIKVKTQKQSSVNTLINTILFDSLIGNHDRHGRNLAFLITTGKCQLSPIYDNVSYLSLETGSFLKADHNPMGRIATQSTENPSMHDYALELQQLGYSKIVLKFLQKLNDGSLDQIYQLIDNSFCSPLMKQALTRLIAKRHQELQNVCKP